MDFMNRQIQLSNTTPLKIALYFHYYFVCPENGVIDCGTRQQYTPFLIRHILTIQRIFLGFLSAKATQIIFLFHFSYVLSDSFLEIFFAFLSA